MTYNEYDQFFGALPATSHVVQWDDAHLWKIDGKVGNVKSMLVGWQVGEPIKASAPEPISPASRLVSIAGRGRLKRAVLLSFIVALFCSCSDKVSSYYATYSEAKEDRLFERGWLPDILPQDTSQISVTNDLDLNTSTGQFHIPPASLPRFKEQLETQSDAIYLYRKQDNSALWVFDIHPSGHVEYQLQ